MYPKSGRTGAGRRRHVTFATMLVAAFVVPVAIAWACNPQAQISLDKTTYQPGSTITVHGSYFTSQPVTVSGPAGSTTVTPSSGGGFTTTLSGPSSAGNYTVSASKPTGGFAPASFRVAAPVAAAPTPSQPSAAPTAAAPAPQQQAARPTPQFDTPSVARSQAPASAERRTTAPARSSGSTTAPRASTGSAGTVTSATGQQVFSGSTAQAAAPVQTFATAPAPAAASSRSSSASRPAPATSSAPAEQAALSDLFSNYEPGRTPSLTGSAAGEPAGGAGSGLGLGIGLLAFGLFSLVAGLTAAEVRRRRVA